MQYPIDVRIQSEFATFGKEMRGSLRMSHIEYIDLKNGNLQMPTVVQSLFLNGFYAKHYLTLTALCMCGPVCSQSKFHAMISQESLHSNDFNKLYRQSLWSTLSG